MVASEKPLYIILTKSNTRMGQLIRFFTHYKYNHVSIALNENLQPLYSFARYHSNSPFVGGFVEESWLRYLYANKDVEIKVYKININADDYARIQNTVSGFIDNKHHYKYDIWAALKYKHAKASTSDYKFTCLTFAEKILHEANIITDRNRINSIEELGKCLDGFYCKNVIISPDNIEEYQWANDEFYRKDTYGTIFTQTLRQFIH